MISLLRGSVTAEGGNLITVDAGGVGYLVTCPLPVARFAAEAREAELVIETVHREGVGTALFGFASRAEREWFRALLAVHGVGVKSAISLLSAFSVAELADAIARGDSKALCKADGVGPKQAARIEAEMGPKVADLPRSQLAKGADADANEVAVRALTALGFERARAVTAVAKAAGSLGPAAMREELVKAALAEASQR